MEQKTYDELQNENEKLKKEVTQKNIEIENLKLHINQLNRYIFGSKKESVSKEENIVEGVQYSIFGEIENEGGIVVETGNVPLIQEGKLSITVK